MEWLKRLWIPLAFCILMPLCGSLIIAAKPYQLLENHYNQPVLPARPFSAESWPKRPYSEQQLPARQAMSDSILREFRPGMTRFEIETKLGTPDRIESAQTLKALSDQEHSLRGGASATSYIVLLDFASGPFYVCFVFDNRSVLKRAFYRWG